MVNTEIRLSIFFITKNGEVLSVQSVKTRLGAKCDSDHDLLFAKLRVKYKKVGKTTNLNQILFCFC